MYSILLYVNNGNNPPQREKAIEQLLSNMLFQYLNIGISILHFDNIYSIVLFRG